MKRVIYIIIVLLLIVGSSHAFLYEIDVLDKKAIEKLSDAELMDVYIDVIVEIKASESFHTTSGYKPQGYKKYKSILRYKILLNQEIEKRRLKAPSLDLQDTDYPETEEDTIQVK